jgi:general secretion pathway protein G
MVLRKYYNSWLKLYQRRRAARGMTLVEIMVVVIIISLITGVVGVTVFNRFNEAQRKIAATQLKEISDALDLYRLSLHAYPSSADGLGALTMPKNGEKPFIKSLPKDPWGNDYVYIYPGVHNPAAFDLFSYGPDGVQSNDDIGNWEAEAGKK